MINAQNDPEELKIAINLIKNIQENNLLFRSFSSIDRIFNIYFQQINRNESEEKQIINFIFKCIDTYGVNALTLFRHLKNSKEKNNIIKRFHDEYEEKYSFNIINSFLFERSIEQGDTNNDHMKISILNILLIFILLLFFIRNNELQKKLSVYEETNKELQSKILSFVQKIDEKQIEYRNDQKQFKNNIHTKSWMEILFALILSFVEMIILLTMNLPVNFHFIFDFCIFIEYVLYFFFAPGNFIYLTFITIPFLVKMILLFDIFVDNRQYKTFFPDINEKSKINIGAVALIAIFNYYKFIS